jgi:uroporphyrinogen-III synthase
MQKNKCHILSTRPLPGELVQEAAVQGCILDEVSFIQTRPIADPRLTTRITGLFQKPITAVFTSMNAVIAIAETVPGSPDWKVYSIGHATAQAIVQHFQIPIAGSANDAAALADVIIRDGVKEAYFFCGDQRRDALPKKLREANIALEEIVVYQTAETPAVVDRHYDAVLFFSPSAVHSFFTVNQLPAATIVFAIGDTTAQAVKKYTSNQIVIAATPDKEALVRQAMGHMNLLKQETE